jgi:Xaa-Pro aminopeptidase
MSTLQLVILATILAIISTTSYGQSEKPLVSIQNQAPYYEDELLPASFHKERRNELRKLMPQNSMAVFFTNPVKTRSNDVMFRFHQDPNFYYLTGLREPNAILIVFSEPRKINGEYTNEILFIQKNDAEKEVWDGTRINLEKARENLGVQTTLYTTDFISTPLPFKQLSLISYSIPNENLKDDPYAKDDLYNLKRQWDAKLFDADEKTIQRNEYTKWMSRLREIKTEEEIHFIKRAIEITCLAQQELMRNLSPGLTEYQTEALVEFIFKMYGAEAPGFPSIQGSGENSCILHYQTNRKRLFGDNLLVSDIGAEYRGYTADVTRTLPVNGKFSPEQTIIYQLVLDAQNAGINAAKAGNNFWDPNIAATTVLSQGLKDLGIIKSPIELKRYFMHGTSHYLGLDVHDAGTYGTLQPNTIITVEPGLYIPEGSPCDSKWWNIGIRIEDDILITEKGPVNLSACVPRTIPEIEATMQTKSSLFFTLPVNK